VPFIALFSAQCLSDVTFYVRGVCWTYAKETMAVYFDVFTFLLVFRSKGQCQL